MKDHNVEIREFLIDILKKISLEIKKTTIKKKN